MKTKRALSLLLALVMLLTAVPAFSVAAFGSEVNNDNVAAEQNGDAADKLTYNGTRKAATYTVTYIANGGVKGTAWKDSETLEAGARIPFGEPAEDFVKAPYGMRFNGLYIDGDLTVDGDEIIITNDLVIKYLWTDITYMIQFDANGGTKGSTWTDWQYAAFGTSFTLTGPSASFVTPPKNCEFSGIELNGVFYAKGSRVEFTEDATYKFIWKKITYKVTYDANGGTEGADWKASQTVNIGTVLTLSVPGENVVTPPENKMLDAFEVNGTRYEKGAKVTVNANTDIRFLWKDKEPLRNGWEGKNGAWRYYVDDVMKTGWFTDKGKKYYFDNNGIAAQGWKKIDGKWYYFNLCAMQTGWRKVGGNWYFLRSNGAMATGWVKSGGKWYWLRSSGAMATGWVKYNKKWYYLNSPSGDMRTANLTYKGKVYKFDKSGACINP